MLWTRVTDPPARAERGLNVQCETCVCVFFFNLHDLCVVEESEKLSQTARTENYPLHSSCDT